MVRVALLVLMLTGIGPALAAMPVTAVGDPARAAAAGLREGSDASDRVVQYRGDQRSWRGEVRHHRYFGRGDDWRRHHRGSYDRPQWRDRHRDESRHDRRRDRPGDHARRGDRTRYDDRHDRRGRWESGGSFRGDDWGRQEGHGRFDDRRRRFDARRDRWVDAP
ncbi:hypothetical protein GTW51_01160 [Aurantimonas aggregata]|uniref:Uncharacterized protein n=1 Tax=Aurantimonas aggregata TaxID=2047720 RepID=A0A6L9MCS7_9HYPH|nr:hypothetical protein [Aurantimonas aggregata]NDV85302.1 hypothetical protein [Aurantimonas aggregata]